METPKLDEFTKRLDSFAIRNVKRYDPDDYDNRHTYCHIVLVNKDHIDKKRHKAIAGLHKFEVRGWKRRGPHLHVSCVNWTMAAGTCSLELNEENVTDFDIFEDNPTLRVLYG